MKRLEPVLEKIGKYGEAFLQFYEMLVLEKGELDEINDRIRAFLTLGSDESEVLSKEEEKQLVSVTLLVKYIQHLQVHGKIENNPICLSLDFFKNLRTLEVVNCGKVGEVRNTGIIDTIFCENSTLPLFPFQNLLKLHYIRTPEGRIDFSSIPRDNIIDFAFKNGKLEDTKVFFDKPWSQVQVWSFRGNRVSNLEPLTTFLPNVVELDLSYNRVSDINVLNNLQRLEVLDLSMNKVTLTGGSSLKVRRLTELNISHNMLSSVSGILGCTNIRVLNISFNQISAFDEIYRLTKLGKLENLTIKGNVVCKEHKLTYIKMVRDYFEFKETFTLDGKLYSKKTEEDEYDKMMQEIQRREAEQAEWKNKKKGKKNSLKRGKRGTKNETNNNPDSELEEEGFM